MAKSALWGLLALAIASCRTHESDECLPTCNSDDQVFFAHCVANGLVDPMTPCQAGNRRCCALASECLGQLDDQTVVPRASSDTCVEAGQCDRPCDTAMDPILYQSCVMEGSANCHAGDENCCALAANCLGDLGDVTVSARGCCQTTADCGPTMRCNPDTWECDTTVAASCGNGIIEVGEDCDDHNTITEDCAYGAMSCPMICNSVCHSVFVTPRFCGDGTIDLPDGETCEPPRQALVCDANCHSLQGSGCTNGVLDGTETDIDCGGGQCAACTPDRSCALASDCRSEHLDCMGRAFCSTDFICIETTSCGPLTGGRDMCLDYGCPDVAGMCPDAATLSGYDHDHDGHSPSASGCGDDCNDLDATVHTGANELCDHIDNDCDELVDENCTP